MLSPLGKACAKMDLTAVHDILLKTGYKDEEGAENEVSEWSIISFTLQIEFSYNLKMLMRQLFFIKQRTLLISFFLFLPSFNYFWM